MTLLVVVAHPDDETFGTGSLVAGAAAEGHRVVVCCATRGEAGEPRPGSVPHGEELGDVREAELREAATLLGVDDVRVLPFGDSGWDGPSPDGSLCAASLDDIVRAVGDVIDDVEPDVVVTLDPGGSDGHRDHQRIAEATTLAFDQRAPVDARLYYWCLVRSVMRSWAEHNRGSVYADLPEDEFGCPDEQITTVVDVAHLLPLRIAAMALHRSQASPYDGLPEDLVHAFLATDRLVRARPPWTGGERERALFPPALGDSGPAI
jgi:LmbE family N-acetylglucosaminyl deacetylase